MVAQEARVQEVVPLEYAKTALMHVFRRVV